MAELFCSVGDVELCYETFGDPADPTALMVMGLGTQMIGWPDGLCAELAGRGFHVVRYDNRDIGRSTRFDSVPPPTLAELARRRPRRLAYTLADMAADGVGLLDRLGVGAAHVVGASMGGMIAQLIAAQHPERTSSLVSIMSSTGSMWSGRPALRVYPFFLRRPTSGRDAYVERLVRLFRLIGSPGFERDEDEMRELAGRMFDRGGANTAGTARQLAAIVAGGSRAADLRRITAPTLVIHGTADRLIASSGGRATARAIAGAQLMLIEGMGHDLPRGAWPRIVQGIVDNAARGRTSWQSSSTAAPTPG